MRNHALIVSCAAVLLAFGCESDDTSDEHAHEDAAVTDKVAKDEVKGDAKDKDAPADAKAAAPFVMRTDKFTIEPGQERYLCYTKTLDEDLVIGGYSSEAQSFVHHLVFVRPLAPEPDGFAECNTLFRMSWEPLYITGAGAAKLDFPKDAGHKLKKGTQLLVQMHLLNTNEKPVEGSVEINMHRSNATDPRSVSAYAFGTRELALPPNQESKAEGRCEVPEKVELIAAFPHMHLLGTSMKFEVGAADSEMKTVFERDPYDFDDQHIEPLKLTLEAGDITRVTCGYDNTGSEVVGFGESTNTEMCFFIAFALDREGLGSCTQRKDQAKQ